MLLRWHMKYCRELEHMYQSLVLVTNHASLGYQGFHLQSICELFLFHPMPKVAPLLLARLNHGFPSPVTVFTLNVLCLEAVTSEAPAPPNFTCSLIYEEREHRETPKIFQENKNSP